VPNKIVPSLSWRLPVEDLDEGTIPHLKTIWTQDGALILIATRKLYAYNDHGNNIWIFDKYIHLTGLQVSNSSSFSSDGRIIVTMENSRYYINSSCYPVLKGRKFGLYYSFGRII
jgi:type IV secretory pathway protease TraF